MICKSCKANKPDDEFYASNKSKCKVCVRKSVRQNRAEKIEHYRAFDRARGNRQSKNYLSDYRNESPAKYRAHNILNNSLRDGHIKKSPCEVCGSEITHAHHDDYFLPLSVRWLCAEHHAQWHAENGEAKNGSATIEEFNIAVYGLKQA